MSEIIDRTILRQISAAYAAGYAKAKADCGELEPYISLKQAYKMYKRATVDRWIDEGLIAVIKDGPNNSKCRIDREAIALVAAASNRESWFEHHDVE
ncbi:hypothetical protein LJB87_00925 [Alistipes sp. OttesenSCG-928-L06]|nr:hypothetical protein [Alistipes sp. OttesenSCG-928-L06]